MGPLPLFFKIVFSTLGPIQFKMNIRSSLSISTKKSAGILIGIPRDQLTNLGSIVILTTLSRPIHEHGMFFQLSGSLVSFNNVSYFSEYMFCTFYCLFLNYFIFFDLIVSRIIFLILFLDGSLQVYRKIVDFVYWSCVLQPCLPHLLILIVF